MSIIVVVVMLNSLILHLIRQHFFQLGLCITFQLNKVYIWPNIYWEKYGNIYTALKKYSINSHSFIHSFIRQANYLLKVQ